MGGTAHTVEIAPIANNFWSLRADMIAADMPILAAGQ
jgi:hypothetical protein